MGKTRGPYKAEFEAGAKVRILDLQGLRLFRDTWTLHHPLLPDQFDHAGRVVEIISCSFYHGGDELYRLRGVPGLWHEQCLTRAIILERDMVVLTVALPERKLHVGDVGTVVNLYPDGLAYEVEFSMMHGGERFALVTLSASQVRPLSSRDLFHVRELSA